MQLGTMIPQEFDDIATPTVAHSTREKRLSANCAPHAPPHPRHVRTLHVSGGRTRLQHGFPCNPS